MATASTMACAPRAPARSAGPEAVLACHRDRLHTVAGPGVIAQGSKRCARHFRRPGWNLAGSRWHPPCQNWRMGERTGSDLAEALSEELAACRKRGIERLDVRSHNQQPVSAPELERLAAEYAAARRSPVHGRIPRLKYLLRDAAAAFREENEVDAQLVSALFFGDSLHRVTKSAGELLDIAQTAVRVRQPRPVPAGQACRL